MFVDTAWCLACSKAIPDDSQPGHAYCSPQCQATESVRVSSSPRPHQRPHHPHRRPDDEDEDEDALDAAVFAASIEHRRARVLRWRAEVSPGAPDEFAPSPPSTSRSAASHPHPHPHPPHHSSHSHSHGSAQRAAFAFSSLLSASVPAPPRLAAADDLFETESVCPPATLALTGESSPVVTPPTQSVVDLALELEGYAPAGAESPVAVYAHSPSSAHSYGVGVGYGYGPVTKSSPVPVPTPPRTRPRGGLYVPHSTRMTTTH